MVRCYIPDFVRPHGRPTFRRQVTVGALAALRELTFLINMSRHLLNRRSIIFLRH